MINRRRILGIAIVVGLVLAASAALAVNDRCQQDAAVASVAYAMAEYRAEQGRRPPSYSETGIYLQRLFRMNFTLTEWEPGRYIVEVRRRWRCRRIEVTYRIDAHGEVENYDVHLAR